MKRTFSFAEARELLQKHEQWETERGMLSEKAEHCRAVVEAAADAFVVTETMKTLRDIPVEELNRARRGLRVRLLRESGYANYEDLMLASERQLAALNGISEDGAALIKDAVGETVRQLRPGIKLRLSADKRTEETSNIVLALYRYRAAEGLSRDAKLLSEHYAVAIAKAMKELSRGKGFFRWLITGRAEKDAASEAYVYLEELANGAYGTELTRLSEARRELEASGAETAWDSFRTQPIVYSNLLEKLVPGLLGNGDAVYGLPEELAREVEAEPLFADGMRCELRRYQAWGVKYILHQGKVLLGDEMGLGKTVQAIAAMVTLRNTGATHFAVVCPASVLVNWCREITKFSDLKAIKVHGPLKQAALEDWIQAGGVAVTSYETVQHWERPEDFAFSLLTVDEAHYIKNPGARRTVHVRNLALRAERLLFMTGTALENRVDEMVELIAVLRPELAAEIGGMKMLASAPRFRELVAPVYYRRKREQVLTELPELEEQESWCQLGAAERAQYEADVLGESYHAARRVSWTVGNIAQSSKARRLLEIAEEAAAEGRKVLIFSFYLDTIEKVRALLGERCMEPITGAMTPARRQEVLDAFEAAAPGQVLAAQIVAGGTGLNIQTASVVILCEPQLKPSLESQAIARAYRMGQARNVLVYRLLCEDSIDERIMELLAEKQAVFDAFADKSSAAEEFELDTKTLGKLMEEEMRRIEAKRGSEASGPLQEGEVETAEAEAETAEAEG